MIYRCKPDDLHDTRPLLDAMGRCRKALLAESDKVRPFGVTFKAIHAVTTAIDAVATLLTGRDDFYAAGGSTTGSETGRWRDSGSDR